MLKNSAVIRGVDLLVSRQDARYHSDGLYTSMPDPTGIN